MVGVAVWENPSDGDVAKLWFKKKKKKSIAKNGQTIFFLPAL